MHERLADLTDRPDALVLYVGHNEFASRFPWMREPGGYYHDDMPSLYSPAALLAVLRFSPFCRLVLETWDRQRIDLRPPRQATRALIDQPVCTPDEYAAILAEFARRLDQIAAYCESIGTLPIFVIPASNDGGYDPNRSVLPPETPRAERAAFARAVERACALEETDPAAALQLDRELAARYPGFAETHYRLGVLLERAGEWDEARRHYIAARDRDAMPLRCPEDFHRAYREVAARHPAVLLVDGPRVLEAASAHGIVDDRLFHDAQHPNLRGYAALARDLLDQLRARKAFGWPEGVATPRVRRRSLRRPFRHRRPPLGGDLPPRGVVLRRHRLYPPRPGIPAGAGRRLPSRRRGHQGRPPAGRGRHPRPGPAAAGTIAVTVIITIVDT